MRQLLWSKKMNIESIVFLRFIVYLLISLICFSLYLEFKDVKDGRVRVLLLFDNFITGTFFIIATCRGLLDYLGYEYIGNLIILIGAVLVLIAKVMLFKFVH